MFPPGRVKRLTAAGAAVAHALEHAKAGFAVLPCSPGGKLLLGLKPAAATLDPVTIHRWWDEAPGASTAVPLGSISGVIAVELLGPPEVVAPMRAATERKLGKSAVSASAAGKALLFYRKSGATPSDELTFRMPDGRKGAQHFHGDGRILVLGNVAKAPPRVVRAA